MTRKIKDYKIFHADEVTPTAVKHQPALMESNVSLYRYGGFAMHSLIKKYELPGKSQFSSNNHDEISVLKQLKIESEQASMVPYGVKYLIREDCLL